MPIYLTGYIDDYTDHLKNYHADILPMGMIVQPKTHREGYLRRAGLYTWVAIDNGRFTEAGRRLFRPAEYDRLIGEGLERAGDQLLFATAPDVPFDWQETLRLSRPWLRRIRRMGCPAALCAQEGMTPGNIPWDDFDCLFIGGRDAFKEGPVVRAACKEARRRGKWVHMGRVNGLRRLWIALDLRGQCGRDVPAARGPEGACRRGPARCRRLAATAPCRAAAKGKERVAAARGRGRAARRPHGRPLTPAGRP
jgi:hypothetical protein